MKAFKIILVSLLALAVIGLLCYQGFVTKDLEIADLVKGVLILAGLAAVVFRPTRRGKVSNKKALYLNAYPEFIQNVFAEDKKLEKQFFNAVDDYNRNKPAAAVDKLSKLRKSCQRSADLYAVTVFTALSLDDMHLYEEAAAHYTSALQMRPNSTLASNLGLCYERLGKTAMALDAYRNAITLNPNNAFVHCNLGFLLFRQEEYEAALENAEQSISINAQLPQALALAAMCCALLEKDEEYTKYYRRAVNAGYDGDRIKATLRSLDASL